MQSKKLYNYPEKHLEALNYWQPERFASQDKLKREWKKNMQETANDLQNAHMTGSESKRLLKHAFFKEHYSDAMSAAMTYIERYRKYAGKYPDICIPQALIDWNAMSVGRSMDYYSYKEELLYSVALVIYDIAKQDGWDQKLIDILSNFHVSISLMEMDIPEPLFSPGADHLYIRPLVYVIKNRNRMVKKGGRKVPAEEQNLFNEIVRMIGKDRKEKAISNFKQKMDEITCLYLSACESITQIQQDTSALKSFTIRKINRGLQDKGKISWKIDNFIQQFYDALSTTSVVSHDVSKRVQDKISAFYIEDPYETLFGFFCCALERDPCYYTGCAVPLVCIVAIDEMPWNYPPMLVPGEREEKFELQEGQEIQDVESPYQQMSFLMKAGEEKTVKITFNVVQMIYAIRKILPRRDCTLDEDVLKTDAPAIEAFHLGENTLRLYEQIVKRDEYDTYSAANLLLTRYKEKKAEEKTRGEEEKTDMPDVSECEQSLDFDIQKYQRIREKVKKLQKALSDTKSELRDANRLVESLKEQTHKDMRELSSLTEALFNSHKSEQEHTEEAEDSSAYGFPFQTERRIVSFGGHSSWLKAIRPMLPNVRFFEASVVPNADKIKHADVIWLQTNCMSHVYFTTLLNHARKYDVPIRYFNYASARKCAEQICTEENNASD